MIWAACFWKGRDSLKRTLSHAWHASSRLPCSLSTARSLERNMEFTGWRTVTRVRAWTWQRRRGPCPVSLTRGWRVVSHLCFWAALFFFPWSCRENVLDLISWWAGPAYEDHIYIAFLCIYLCEVFDQKNTSTMEKENILKIVSSVKRLKMNCT